MNKLISLALCFLIAVNCCTIGGGLTVAAASPENNKIKNLKQQNISGEILIKLKGDIEVENDPGLNLDGNGRGKWHKALKHKANGKNNLANIYRREVAKGSEKDYINKLSKNPNVEWAELNSIVTTEMMPNDPYYQTGGSWGQTYDDLWGVKNINANDVWDQTQGSNVTVAVIDTGVDYTHEDLADNIWQNRGETGIDANGLDKKSNGLDDDANGYVDDWHGWDSTTITMGYQGYSYKILGTKEADNDPIDDHGHGTHVAGTIAAVGNNSLGIIGVAPQAKIMPLKFLTQTGNGSYEDAAAALIYAADNGANVINCSWGGTSYSHLLNETIEYAISKNIAVVAAAGNTGGENWVHIPSALPGVISVSASDSSNQIANFSSYGKVDVAAPGVEILSTKANGTNLGGKVIGDKYEVLSGTSMASPHVAGLAAQILSQYPDYAPGEVRQQILKTADDLGDNGFDQHFGYGLVNAQTAANNNYRAAAEIKSPLGITTSSQQVITGTADAASFSHYTLEYGNGNYPDVWNMLNEGNASVNNGILGNWDASALSGGYYTLRLTVYDEQNVSYESRDIVYIDQPYTFTAPSVEVFSPTEASVSWSGNREVSNTYLEYGLDDNYGTRVADMQYYPEDMVQILDLQPSTTYHFRLVAEEFAQQYSSSDYTFTTPSPAFEITDIHIIPEPHQATISWQTSAPTSTLIQYNDVIWADNLDYSLRQEYRDAGLTTSHQVVLSNLTDNFEYYFIIKSQNADGAGVTSSIQSFTTLPGQYAIASNIAISDISDTGAVVSWESDIASSAILGFYGSCEREYYSSYQVNDEEYATSHRVVVNGLRSASLYRVGLTLESTDGSRSYFIAPSFQTLESKHLSEINIQPSSRGITVSWRTDIPSDSKIWYWTGEVTRGATTSYVYNADQLYQHSLDINLLQPETSYSLLIKDSASGEVFYSKVNTATTLADPLDSVIPSGTVVINNNAEITNSAQVNLTLSATDNVGVNKMQFSNDGVSFSDWENYATGKAWTMASGDSEKYVYARFKDFAGNESEISYDSIYLDQTPPSASVVANGGNHYANSTLVELSITASDNYQSGQIEMRFSNDNSNFSDWQPYTDHKSWQTSDGEGLKYIYANFRDVAGNFYAYTELIMVDMTVPQVNPPLTSSPTENASPTWTWESGSDNYSGFDNGSYEFFLGTTPGGHEIINGLCVLNYFYTYPQSLAPGIYYAYLTASDYAGNEASSSISPVEIKASDTIAPTGSISIANGANYSKEKNVAISVEASDNIGVVEMQFSSDGVSYTDWESYANSKSWVLSGADGTKTVYARFRDAAGNISTVFYDSIVLDTTAPGGSVSINKGAVSTKTSTVTLKLAASDALSGLNLMRFSNDGISWSSWQGYAASASWTLSSGKGSKYVYVQFQDKAGNISGSVYDTIVRK